MDARGEPINQCVIGEAVRSFPSSSFPPRLCEMTFHVGPLLPLFALGVHVALSQVSFATCEGDEYVWVSASTAITLKIRSSTAGGGCATSR